MDKQIENAMNRLINAEIWSTNLYLSLQVYFEEQQLPVLASWLNAQAQENMNKAYQLMNRIYHDGSAVTIHEIKRESQQWLTPLAALNTLLEHEQHIFWQISDFHVLCQLVAPSIYPFVKDLYTKRIYVSSAFIELLRILSVEYKRRLPDFW
ncbi:ferritin-like domain-containing protein [Parabacteroides timonensis]|uniref:ferritin-like domain-containing protein n=1 Tax=Parabacteroides timonensis TaxID=1871013 RepID=UPI00094ED373|nr:ferritin-like domain-containing protein [Parabacteroides timonensis]